MNPYYGILVFDVHRWYTDVYCAGCGVQVGRYRVRGGRPWPCNEWWLPGNCECGRLHQALSIAVYDHGIPYAWGLGVTR